MAVGCAGKHQSRTPAGAAAGAQERLVMVTGIPTAPCTNPYGDYLLSLSIRNKQDWARLHAYELHLMAEAVTSHIRAGPWQKVGFIQKARALRCSLRRCCRLLQTRSFKPRWPQPESIAESCCCPLAPPDVRRKFSCRPERRCRGCVGSALLRESLSLYHKKKRKKKERKKQKIELACMLRAQALQEIPRERAEWILWLDMDLLINRMDFVLPLLAYEGKDMVLHGNPEFVLQGEAQKGAPLNCLVFGGVSKGEVRAGDREQRLLLLLLLLLLLVLLLLLLLLRTCAV
jgi:hypothetical protein